MTSGPTSGGSDPALQEAQWGMPEVTERPVVTPERLAYEARMRGERTFQIDLVISRDQGFVHATRGPYTRTKRVDHGDVLDRIEEQGWRLEHVALAHAQTGSIGHEGYPWFAFHGTHTALYVFRRVDVLGAGVSG